MDSVTAKPRKTRHIPRRTGVGARQVIAPAKPKRPRIRINAAGPVLCGAEHPELLGLACTAELPILDHVNTKGLLAGMFGPDLEVEYGTHRGQHRTRPLRGVVIRWAVDR